jgi:hypothetical protein
MSFTSEDIGRATIIDIGKTSSVAKITYLVDANNLRVGDGAKITTSRHRTYFERKQFTPSATLSDATIALQTPKKVLATSEKLPDSPMAPSIPPAPIKDPLPARTSVILPNGYDASIGTRSWDLGGALSSGSSWQPYIPVDFARISSNNYPSKSWAYRWETNAGWGKTRKHGTYLSYVGEVNPYLFKELDRDGPLSELKLGLDLSYVGMSVFKEAFGGYDFILTGLYLGAEGLIDIPIVDGWSHWQINLIQDLYGSGQVGYRGDRLRGKNIKSQKVEFLVLLPLATDEKTASLGFGLHYRNLDFTDSKNKKHSLNDFALTLNCLIPFAISPF